jgi:hypothetical protein
MSGRSAYVRKEKTKTKDVSGENGSEKSGSIHGDFPLRSSGKSMYRERDSQSRGHGDHPPPKVSLDDSAYARVRKPQVPVLDVSGIEKSSFRSLMDKKSEGVRNGLAKTFGRRKKEDEPRPQTVRTLHPERYELDHDDHIGTAGDNPRQEHFDENPEVDGQAAMSTARSPPNHSGLPDYIRSGPPQGKLPPIPQGPQLKRWVGGGKPAQPWNKLRKDPELWDANGDTLIYLAHEDRHSARPQPSFRVSSHVLESTESRYFINALREGSTEDVSHFNLPPSPIGSLAMGVPHTTSNRYDHTPPLSDNSLGGYDGQISYELYFAPPAHLHRTEAIRHQVGTRNVLAILYQASFVGINFVQALKDVQERLEDYMPSSVDVPSLIIDYIIGKGLDDIHENPSLAAAMLSWSEGDSIRWEEAWRESFVHCAGMHSKVENSPDFRFITPITRALLERSSLEMQVRIHTCETALVDFDFGEMLALVKPGPTGARKAFDNLRAFFLQYYQRAYGTWPPPATADEEQWFTRRHAQRLQEDFGALYNYLVNREITWDCSEASAGRKWNMVHSGKRAFDADTHNLPLTDVLIAFDNKHSYPHIPHPYPLVPQPVFLTRPKDTPSKISKKGSKAVDDKMAERRAALAYTESTNIYLLGSDFVGNDMVDQFVKFEKADLAAGSDPFESRRGRWILIYGILQTLATVSVDTPNMHYVDVPYHLSANLRGTPPWKGAPDNSQGAEHDRSYCWMIPGTWINYQTSSRALLDTADSDDGRAQTPFKSYRGRHSPMRRFSATSNPSLTGTETSSVRFAPPSPLGHTRHRWWKNSDREGVSTTGYAPGIEKVDDWPRNQESLLSNSDAEYIIRDYDDHAM